MHCSQPSVSFLAVLGDWRTTSSLWKHAHPSSMHLATMWPAAWTATCMLQGRNSNPTFRNSSTWPASGAPPLRMRLTRPPRRALILEKTSLSKSGVACAQLHYFARAP